MAPMRVTASAEARVARIIAAGRSPGWPPGMRRGTRRTCPRPRSCPRPLTFDAGTCTRPPSMTVNEPSAPAVQTTAGPRTCGRVRTNSRWLPGANSGDFCHHTDLLFVDHEEVDVVEQSADLPRGGGGVETRRMLRGFSRSALPAGPAASGFPAAGRGHPRAHGGEPCGDVFWSEAGVRPGTYDDLVFALVIDSNDRRSGGGAADDPQLTGIDVRLGEDLDNPPAVGVVPDGACEFHMGAGAGRCDCLVAALAAGAECGV